jgi:hypothetical protein
MGKSMSHKAKKHAKHFWLLVMTSIVILFILVSAALYAKPNDSQLVMALSGEDAVARFMAVEELTKMGDTAIPSLEPLATSSGITLERKYAISILGSVGTEKAVEILLRILEKEQDVHIRGMVCHHLGWLGVEEAVPIIGRWLYTIQGKSFDWLDPRDGKKIYGSARILCPVSAWMEHVYALWRIGGKEAITILETMVKTKHGSDAGKELMFTYKQHLAELKKEEAFLDEVRRVPGLESHVKRLFSFFRSDKLAIIRLYHDKIIRGGLEGRWVLEGLKNHPDPELRQAAATLLKHYEKIQSSIEHTKPSAGERGIR